MPMTKITLVGAGSVVFAKNLVCDILQYPALQESIICLMDIDAGRLAVTEKLMRRIVAQLGVNARIEATLDLRAACAGAKFVITTIQVGGYKPSTAIDFEIPAKYGVEQTIADTLGVGGVFRALRSIPELIKVARMLQDVGAPDALLLNYTNPMAMNMWAIDRATGLNSVGLCHSVQGTSRQISSYCGFDPEDVSYLVAGINHMAFFLKFEYKGKDAYPHLFRALENEAALACDRVRFEMMRRLGYFVTESSEHQSEYVPYFIHHGKEVQEEFNVPINEYIRRCESMVGRWEKIESDLLDESKKVEIGRSVEYGSTIINSIVSGELSVIYGNVPNRSLITNLTDGCSVEVPCLVDKQGIQPTHIGKLPPQLAAIIHTNLNVQELTVEAALTGRRDYIYQAVMMDPHTATVLTLDKIWAMCDEMIEAHQKTGYLGDFKPVLRNTGKPLSAVSRVFLSVEAQGVPFHESSLKGEFSLIAENRTEKDFEGEVIVEPSGGEFAAVPPLKVKVAAGESIRVPFEVEALGVLEGEVKLSLRSESLETVEEDLRLPKRQQCVLPVSPTGEKRLPFEVVWSGNVAAHGSMWLTDSEFVLEATIDDTDLRTEETFFAGSAVELGFSPISRNSSPKVVIALPDPQKPSLTESTRFTRGKEIEGARVDVTPSSEGYTVAIRCPLATLGLQPGQPFLFDVAFHINALGTAHGKIREAWQGSASVAGSSARFAVMVPTC